MSSPANHYMPGDEILCGPRPSSGTYTDDAPPSTWLCSLR